MDAERSNVRARFARHPEDTQMPVIVEFDELAFMNRTNAKLSLDG